MTRSETLFRCVLERAAEDGRERRVIEVWAPWPGTAREIAGREPGEWRVVGVEADFWTYRNTRKSLRQRRR